MKIARNPVRKILAIAVALFLLIPHIPISQAQEQSSYGDAFHVPTVKK